MFSLLNNSTLAIINNITNNILSMLLLRVKHKPMIPSMFIIINGTIRFLSLSINILLTCVLICLYIWSLLVPSIVLVLKSSTIILNSLLLSSFSVSSSALIIYSFTKHNAIFCVSLLTLNDSLLISELENRNKQTIEQYTKELKKEKTKKISFQTTTGLSIIAIILLLLL